MKCPMTFNSPCAECTGQKCAWWVQKTHQEYNAERGRYEAVSVEAEGCAVAFTAVAGGGRWIVNDGSVG